PTSPAAIPTEGMTKRKTTPSTMSAIPTPITGAASPRPEKGKRRWRCIDNAMTVGVPSSWPYAPGVLTRDDIGVHLTSEVIVEGETCPGLSHTIDHPDGLILVDTGMIDSTPELDEHWHVTPHPLPPELVDRVAHVVITHMHFDHM